jgi:hypothetical protein
MSDCAMSQVECVFDGDVAVTIHFNKRRLLDDVIDCAIGTRSSKYNL